MSTTEDPIKRLEEIAEFRIVGGYAVTTLRKYDWITSLRSQGAHVCGGMLIHPSWILTAKHCSKTMPYPIEAWIGGLDLTKKQDFAIRTVVQNVDHPSLDCLLLKLDKPVTERNLIKVNSNVNVPPGNQLVTLGWGRLAENGQLSNTLQEVVLPVVSNDKCTTLFGDRFVAASMLCAGFESGAKDACQGDSGGPLIVQSNPQDASSQVLVGMTSLGIGCAREGKYSVWINIAAILQWIQQYIPDIMNTAKDAFSGAAAPAAPAAYRNVGTNNVVATPQPRQVRHVFEYFRNLPSTLVPSWDRMRVSARETRILIYLLSIVILLCMIFVVKRYT
jgi:secreted trypsin-like serine protease